ncbi:nephrin isoform X1 [Spodoptera frugiperda]|uniref:Nephrin isoform X1 n=1 Tax=Spodoptera frugiperda TaxID=7108 RepID=A0A9R0D0P1_SPOFR|nr:nephrin isoform X1 [Spodoptera frugiperda]
MNSFIYLTVIVLLLNSLCAQEIYEKVDAVLGQSVELPCNVTSEKKNDKLNILAWYRNGSTTAFYSSRDLRHGDKSTTSTSNRYRLVTGEAKGEDKLQIANVRASDAGLYTCLADFAASPAYKTHVQLAVIEPPRHLWVVHENGTQVAKASAGSNTSQNVGPYYVGDTVHLACVAYGGKPLASLSWWTDQRFLKNTLTPLSEHRVRGDLIYGPLQREDHGRVFTCLAKNNEIIAPLSIDITIDMYLPPDLVSLRSEGPDSDGSTGRVRAGEALALQCRVLGARPLPPIVWRLADNQLLNLEQKITMEPSQRLVVSDIQLTIDRKYDESHITCCAPAHRRNSEQFVCAQPLPLTVLYPPILEIVVTDADVENNTVTVIKGSNLSLACSYQANPDVYELLFIHKEDIIVNTDKDSKGNVQQFLEIKNVTEKDGGEYACVANNNEGSTYSEPINIHVIYPSYCEDNAIMEYGVGVNEAVNLTCNVKSNPAPKSYRWILVNEAVNISTLRNRPHESVETEDSILLYQRPNGTDYSTIFCWGQNDVPSKGLIHTPCTFLVTGETIPRPPSNCEAKKNSMNDIIIACEKGHDGGLPQKFKFTVQAVDTEEELVSITNLEPKFMIQEPSYDNYKFVIIAFNDKGESQVVEVDKGSIVSEEIAPPVTVSSVRNITTLALALCGGVALVALAACGLVLCTYDRTSRLDLPRDLSDPPLCAYNTEESNCETYHDSDEGSECNVRRTDSFRRAVSRHSSKNFDVRRTSSFHSARYMHDAADPEAVSKCNEIPRHTTCRVHSLQNIHRKKEMDALCDHLVLHLPPETNYNVPRPMNTFYTMPRKMRHKLAKELSDETSEITQNSDGFSLPPPPDEFGTYRAGTRIKDMPTKSTPTYTTVIRKNSTGRDPTKQQYNVSTMNTVGLPTVSGGQHGGVYSYPDDDHHPSHPQDTLSSTGGFQTYFTPRESGL